jgi:sec-independent protein translocase protein TatB
MISPPPIMMANLGMSDTIILMVLALVVFGPRRLPQIGRQIGKLMYEFRKASNDFKFQMDEEFRKAEEADRRKKEEEERQRALAAGTLPAAQLESTATQAPETGTAALETGEPAPILYPNEPIYPDPADEGAPTGETAPPAVAETAPPAADPTVPRIQPPSTGETVAAEPPGTQPRQQELFAPDPGKAPESVNSEAITSGPEAERSEPAAHHG